MPYRFLFIFLFTFQSLIAQVQVVSWNIANFGASKTSEQVVFLAQYLRSYDIVVLQEIVAVSGGAQQIAAMIDALNRKGRQWDYDVSAPTLSSAYKTERYAYLWKPSRVQLIGKPWLESTRAQAIYREPCYATFQFEGHHFTLENFHAITASKQPEREIKYFNYLPAQYPQLRLLFFGDFNCIDSHTVFNPLRQQGYLPAFTAQKTSLKKNCVNGDCLSKPFDNFWYPKDFVRVVNPTVLHFYRLFSDFTAARSLSDHVLILVTLEFL